MVSLPPLSPAAPMPPSQVILNSLNGLFQISELATKHMMDAVDCIDIPDDWENVDLIKQTESLLCTTAGLSLTDELLYVRKTQAIVEFCIECKNLLKALKLDISQDGVYIGVGRVYWCMQCEYVNIHLLIINRLLHYMYMQHCTYQLLPLICRGCLPSPDPSWYPRPSLPPHSCSYTELLHSPPYADTSLAPSSPTSWASPPTRWPVFLCQSTRSTWG